MRQPARLKPMDPDPDRYLGPMDSERRRRTRPRPAPSTWRASSMTASPAVRAILALVAVVLLATLIYLLSLSSQPSFGRVRPVPNSETPPGIVLVEAAVDSGRPIQRVTLTIDGNAVQPAVSVHDNRSWTVRYQEVFAPGRHDVQVTVVDEAGEVQEHNWSFVATGSVVKPEIALTGPDPGSVLAPGLMAIQATIGSDTAIRSVELTLNGQEVEAALRPASNLVHPAASDMQSGDERWTISTERALPAGDYLAKFTVTDEHDDVTVQEFVFRVSSNPGDATVRYFSASGQYLRGPFKQFWEQHDGALVFGHPVSQEFVRDDGLIVQYFEHARFELSPDQTVNLGRLGHEVHGRTDEPVSQPDNPAIRFFPETGHTVRGPFEEFWRQHGELAIFGYPISEVIDEDGRQVQYFERARFDLIEEDGAQRIELAPLGTQLWAERSRTT